MSVTICNRETACSVTVSCNPNYATADTIDRASYNDVEQLTRRL